MSVFVAWSVARAGAVMAGTGDLDPTFDGDGRVSTVIPGPGDDTVNDLVLQPDGKIIAVGQANFAFGIVRYNVDGTLDTGFSGDGILQIAFSSDAFADAAALQPADNRIVVGGATCGVIGDCDFALVRVDSSGILDTAFGGDGIVTTSFGTGTAAVTGVAVQSDGRIVAVGPSGDGFGSWGIARYDPDGSLDTTFDGDGLTAVPIGGQPQAVVLDAFEKILVVGMAAGASDDDFGVVRLNTDGSLDATFDGDGIVTTDLGMLFEEARGVAIQSDGKIVVTGRYNFSDPDFALLRYDSTGALDPTFGTGGVTTTDILGLDNESNDVAIDGDGRIVIAGTVRAASWAKLVARYDSNGALDTSFASSSSVPGMKSGAQAGEARAVVVQPDGRIVVGGGDRFGGDQGFGLIRLLDKCTNGTLDSGEACDDGNTAANDGCTPGCQVEGCFACSGEPSTCTPITACANGDGCCPDGCSTVSDDDCVLPTTTTSTTSTSTTGTTLGQPILGKSFAVKDPSPGVDPTLRSVTVVGKELASDDVIVGDPMTAGATVQIIANGNASTSQILVLPPGASVSGSAGWKAMGSPVIGYGYKDASGSNGPVKTALIKKAPDGKFVVKVTLKGALGPGPQPHVTVLPPAPGTDGGMRFTINDGSTYCVAFGGAAGGAVTNAPTTGSSNKVFKIVSKLTTPTVEAGCPTPAP